MKAAEKQPTAFNTRPVHVARRVYLEARVLDDVTKSHVLKWFDWLRDGAPHDPLVDALLCMSLDFYTTSLRLRTRLMSTPEKDFDAMDKILTLMGKTAVGMAKCRQATGLRPKGKDPKGRGQKGTGCSPPQPPRAPRPSELQAMAVVALEDAPEGESLDTP